MSEKRNKLSVALCTYNGELYLKRQLDSILNQTYPIDEIIIVDDCSSDSTRSILNDYKEKFSSIKLFFNEENLGPNGAFKYAISLASNEFIALSDQDDIWFENKVELQMTGILKNGHHLEKKPILSFHDLCLIDENDRITDNSFWKVHKFMPESFTFKKLLISNIVTGCTCVINKSMRDELVKCDMQNIIMHDYLIALIGYGFGTVIYISEPLMYYRSHSSSVTEKEKITFKNRIDSFISRVNNGKYLMPHILQIKQFKDLYESKLNLDKLNMINYFLKFEKKNVFNRMIYRWLIN